MSVVEDFLPALRAEVREFLAERRECGAFTPTVDCWLGGWDEEFSRELARRGWLGMTIPTAQGGHGRSYLERYVVTQELLTAGAPVAAHWIADRQAAPSLLKYGTPHQQERYLPAISRGECYFAIGMSEPDSGSDLASVRTRAIRADGGWVLRGSKVWTSNAHRSHAFFVLARSAPGDEGGRHDGLTQFIVRLDSPGVTVNPIISMGGDHHFNEVVLDDVFVGDADVLGEVGNGWLQVTSELKYERSGPERFLSTFPALQRLGEVEGLDEAFDIGVGGYVARLAGLHHLSFDVARLLEAGQPAELQASMVKVVGTLTEADLADDLAEWTLSSRSPQDPLLEGLVSQGLLRRAGFTLRGGTNEILRGLIAKKLKVK